MIQTIQTLFLRNERVSMFSTGALMLMAVVGMGLISLTTLNSKATKGYVLNQIEEMRQELVTDGEITDMMILYAGSLTTIENSVTGMYKPSTDEVSYVMPITSVAQN